MCVCVRVCVYGYVPRYLLDPSWRVQVNKYNIYIYIYVCVCARVCVRLRAALPTRPLVARPGMYIYMYVCICVCVYIYIYICVCTTMCRATC